jgi:hypothetical protein
VSEDSHNLERSLTLAPCLHHQNFDDVFTLSLWTPILVGWDKVLSCVCFAENAVRVTETT